MQEIVEFIVRERVFFYAIVVRILSTQSFAVSSDLSTAHEIE
jgi:hypothetical protein